MTDSELNEAVAFKLGWEKNVDDGRWRRLHKISSEARRAEILTDAPSYSTSIQAVWEIVEKSDRVFQLNRSELLTPKWFCQIDKGTLGPMADGSPGQPWAAATADTAPRAICEAFLKLP